MQKNKSVNVYWSPVYDFRQNGFWNMLYPEPKTLMSELISEKSTTAGDANFFSCPVSNNHFKNTYVFRSAIRSEHEYDFTDVNNPKIFPIGNQTIEVNTLRAPTLKNTAMLHIANYAYIFFAEESLNLSFSPPFFSEPGYTKYGTSSPGSYDISQWFRPYIFELLMWKEKGKIIIEENEPLFYVTGNNDKQINLKRFNMNDKLFSYMTHCVSAPNWQGRGLPLLKRYEIFKKSRMNEIILSEIKQNLV